MQKSRKSEYRRAGSTARVPIGFFAGLGRYTDINFASRDTDHTVHVPGGTGRTVRPCKPYSQVIQLVCVHQSQYALNENLLKFLTV